jgi:mono/diheme cytochrome c family protein
VQWFGALGMAVIAFVFQLTGNLLPMDRHAVQTAVVESGITGGIPAIGHTARGLMLGGPSFSESTLALWWAGHAYVLPIVSLVAAWMLFRRRKAPLSAYAIAPIAVLGLALLVAAPLGARATDADFGQFNASVSWYTWPLHSMMVAFGHLSPNFAWIGSVAIPSLIFLALLLMPWIGQKVPNKIIRGTALLIALAFAAVGDIDGGPVASLTGNRDPAVGTASGGAATKATDPKTLALVARGMKEFNDDGCADCHGTNGAKGESGPDLTHEFQLHSDPAWFAKLIRNPKMVNVSATMPAFPKLSDDQVNAISTFLSQPR